MLIETPLSVDDDEYDGKIDEPSTCPICKYAIKPVELFRHVFEDNDENYFVTFLYLCTHCYKTFVVLHSVKLSSDTKFKSNPCQYAATLMYTEPNIFIRKDFDKNFMELSPMFCKIYNQAVAAESYNLDEIAGIGYRKAVEFLVKDYIIHFQPEKEKDIKTKLLMQCINKDIADNALVTLASRSVWIGNDETHYVRRHESKDINDLKRFIQAMVNHIDTQFIIKEAEKMNPK